MEYMNYRELVEKILADRAKYHQETDTEVELIFDRERDHYQILFLGWPQQKRVFGCPIHIDIKNGKIWIQRDDTELEIAKQLIEAGVPKQDIVLGFKAPYKRQYTEFAVG